MVKPSVKLDADAVTADASKGFWFVTGTNTGTKDLTSIDKAKKGVAYIIECGDTTNVTSVQKSGNFDSIESAWTPTAVGDYIMVKLDSKNKFIELERCVGGTRTINVKAQPNVPGAR